MTICQWLPSPLKGHPLEGPWIGVWNYDQLVEVVVRQDVKSAPSGNPSDIGGTLLAAPKATHPRQKLMVVHF